MTRLRHEITDGKDLVVDPRAAAEFASAWADLFDGIQGEAPAAPADDWLAEINAAAPVVPEPEDQEVEDQVVEDIDAWLSTLVVSAQVAPAVDQEVEDQESQASAPVVVSPAPTTKTPKTSKKARTPKTVTKPDRTALAVAVGDAIKSAGKTGIRSDTLEKSVCRSASQRVGELRRQGWIIDSVPINGSDSVRYVYMGMTQPKPVPTAGVRLYTYEDGSISARSFVGVTDPDESQEMAEAVAAFVSSWITGRQGVTP